MKYLQYEDNEDGTTTIQMTPSKMKTYNIFDMRRGVFDDEVKMSGVSPIQVAKKYLQPSNGQQVKRTDSGFIVITGPDYKKFVYGLVG